MNLLRDAEWIMLLSGVVGFMVLASIAGLVLHTRAQSETTRRVVSNLNARYRAWWSMLVIFTVADIVGTVGSTLLFGVVSFVALREFITLMPTHRADHRTLFWTFFLFVPVQYYLVAVDWYGLFSIFIPVYAFLFITTRNVMEGDPEQFLRRTAQVHWGVMVCVYCVSHAPALLTLPIPNFEDQHAKLIFFLVITVQMCDVLQYVIGAALGRRLIASRVSPGKTWEGVIGGILGASLIGTGLWWITPFTPWQAAVISLVITVAGTLGDLCMAAIKHDFGVPEAETLVQRGMLDRIDALSFAAPVLFHLTRFWFT